MVPHLFREGTRDPALSANSLSPASGQTTCHLPAVGGQGLRLAGVLDGRDVGDDGEPLPFAQIGMVIEDHSPVVGAAGKQRTVDAPGLGNVDPFRIERERAGILPVAGRREAGRLEKP